MLAQALPFLITPIVTRIYSPESFGSFSLLVSIVAISSIVATMRYELAVVISEISHVKYLLALNFGTSLIVSLLSGIFLFAFARFYSNFINDSAIYFLVPLGIFVTGASSSLTYLLTRFSKFNVLGCGSILRSVTYCFFQLSLFLLFSQTVSLIASWVLSSLCMLLYMVFSSRSLLAHADLTREWSVKELASVAVEYSNYPKFSMPASLLGAVNSQFNIVAISMFYAKDILGCYVLIERILAAPISIVGNAVGQVYYSLISTKSPEEILKVYKLISLKMSCLASLFFIFIYFGLTNYVVGIFGYSWSYTSILIKIFAAQFSVQLVVSPLLMTLQRFKLNKIEFAFQVVNSSFYVLVYCLGNILGFEREVVFGLIAAAITVSYSSMFLFMMKFLSNESRKAEFK